MDIGYGNYEKGFTWGQVVGYQVVRYMTSQNHLKTSDTNNMEIYYNNNNNTKNNNNNTNNMGRHFKIY